MHSMPPEHSQSSVQEAGVGALMHTSKDWSQVRPSGQMQLARQVKKQEPETQVWSGAHSLAVRHSTFGSFTQKLPLQSWPAMHSLFFEHVFAQAPSTQRKSPWPQSVPVMHSGSGRGAQTEPRQVSLAVHWSSSTQSERQMLSMQMPSSGQSRLRSHVVGGVSAQVPSTQM